MIKKLLLVLLSIVAGLLITEFLLRFLNIPPESNKAFQRKDIAWIEANVDLNSAGYRDREYPVERTGDNLRIYALGDSYTYGWLVNNFEDTYPKILEKSLNRNGTKTEVINAGSPGFSLPEMVNRYLTEGKYYYPDLVVLGINDDEANYSKTYVRPKDNQFNPFIKSLNIYQITFGNYFKRIAEKANHDYVLNIYTDNDSEEWKNTVKEILKLKKEVEKTNAKMAIVLYPHIHPNRPNDPYDYQAFNDRFKKFSDENGIILIDPLEDFLKVTDKTNLVINPLDPHPTAQMNQLVSKSFVNKFNVAEFMSKRNLLIPQKKSVIISPENLTIGNYTNLLSIKGSTDNNWVYFETKYGTAAQNFPLKDKSFRNSKVYLDSLQTVKSYTHSYMPGASITYHIYPNESGEINVPKNLYNFEIIGINHIYALAVLSDGTTTADYITPSEVIKDSNGLKIKFTPGKDYHVYRLNLKAAVKQLDIDPQGNIANITKTYLVRTKQNKKSNFVTLPFSEKVSSWAGFSGEDTKAYSYAFVDGRMEKVKEVKTEGDQIVLEFNFKVNEGEEVEFPVMASYKLGDGEKVEVIYE